MALLRRTTGVLQECRSVCHRLVCEERAAVYLSRTGLGLNERKEVVLAGNAAAVCVLDAAAEILRRGNVAAESKTDWSGT